MGDGSLDFEFPGRLNFDGGAESHPKVALLVLGKALLEGLLEKSRVERVAHHHVAAGRIDTRLHLVKTLEIRRGRGKERLTRWAKEKGNRIERWKMNRKTEEERKESGKGRET